MGGEGGDSVRLKPLLSAPVHHKVGLSGGLRDAVTPACPEGPVRRGLRFDPVPGRDEDGFHALARPECNADSGAGII